MERRLDWQLATTHTHLSSVATINLCFGRCAAMRLSVVLPPHVGTCLASVVHELVQRLEDAAPLARPDAADGRRHRRLGEVGYVLGQLLLVLFLHRRRFVWLPRADFGCSFLNDVGMVRPARLPCFPAFKGPGTRPCRLHFKDRESTRETGGCRYGHRGQRDSSLHTAAGRLF